MSSSDGKDSFILLINIGLENARGGSTFRCVLWFVLCICSYLTTSALKCFNSFSEEVVEATDGEECLKSQLIKYMDTGY